MWTALRVWWAARGLKYDPQDFDRQKQKAAIAALGKIAHPRAADTLMEFLRAVPDDYVVVNTAVAAALIETKDPRVPEFLVSILSRGGVWEVAHDVL
jgi:HEAT repeat protein